jgi:hypothetical protein
MTKKKSSERIKLHITDNGKHPSDSTLQELQKVIRADIDDNYDVDVIR